MWVYWLNREGRTNSFITLMYRLAVMPKRLKRSLPLSKYDFVSSMIVVICAAVWGQIDLLDTHQALLCTIKYSLNRPQIVIAKIELVLSSGAVAFNTTIPGPLECSLPNRCTNSTIEAAPVSVRV